MFFVTFSSLIVQPGLTDAGEVEEVENDPTSRDDKGPPRPKRRGGSLIEDIVGIWFPVYIPQAETAYNDFSDELPKYNPPKPHYHVIIYSLFRPKSFELSLSQFYSLTPSFSLNQNTFKYHVLAAQH